MSDLGNKEIMASNLQSLMKQKGIDRNKLCYDLGFKYSTVRDWIKENIYPRIEKMANYFNVEKSGLVEKYNPDKKIFDLKKAIDNDEIMSYGGKTISPLEKEMVKRIFDDDK